MYINIVCGKSINMTMYVDLCTVCNILYNPILDVSTNKMTDKSF